MNIEVLESCYFNVNRGKHELNKCLNSENVVMKVLIHHSQYSPNIYFDLLISKICIASIITCN